MAISIGSIARAVVRTVSKVVSGSPLGRKAVRRGIVTALVGGGVRVFGDAIVTNENIVPIINAFAEVLIALGTIVAAWKGRAVRQEERVP